MVTVAVGFFAMRMFGVDSNPAVAGLSALSTSERVLFLLKTIPQLFGEELFTIVPFLAAMHFLVTRLRVARKAAIVWAWLGTAALFALVHLPTYNWNLVQVLLLIGLARLILTLPYLETKNIWVSTGAHIVNDWSFFGVTILGDLQRIS